MAPRLVSGEEEPKMGLNSNCFTMRTVSLSTAFRRHVMITSGANKFEIYASFFLAIVSLYSTHLLRRMAHDKDNFKNQRKKG